MLAILLPCMLLRNYIIYLAQWAFLPITVDHDAFSFLTGHSLLTSSIFVLARDAPAWVAVLQGSFLLVWKLADTAAFSGCTPLGLGHNFILQGPAA